MKSQVLKNASDDAPKLCVPNPTLAQDLQLDSVEKIIPNQLFNFLAWVTALSSDPLDGGNKQCVVIQDENSRRKLLSICQDIIYLKSKGRALVRKHLVLRMTVRHLTGC